MVMCNFLRKREVSPGDLSPNPDRSLDASDPVRESLSAYPLCPRLLLSTTLQQSVVESGVSYMIGFELEVVLLQSTSPEVVPVDGDRRDHAWSKAAGMRSGSEGYRIVTKIVDALEEAGVTVEQWHPESAPGQFEIVLAPHAPFQAADELIFAREVRGPPAPLCPSICLTKAPRTVRVQHRQCLWSESNLQPQAVPVGSRQWGAHPHVPSPAQGPSASLQSSVDPRIAN